MCQNKMVEETYQGRYYRTYAAVDLDALCSNILNTKKRVGADTKIMAVVKADGYGHGAVPIARAFDELMDNGKPVVAAYGVAMVEEGIELRRAGITKPILVLGHITPGEIAEAVRYKIAVTVSNFDSAQAASQAAVLQGSRARIHIKVDTGMGRIGYCGKKKNLAEIVQIHKLPGIVVEGLFSHFAKADEAQKDSSYKQLENFKNFISALEKAGVCPPVKHIANSAGIIDLPQAYFDMVRSGISTYGLYPSSEVDVQNLELCPALELKSHISFVKRVAAGTRIGYGGTYIAQRSIKVATVQAGYADGYPRALSNKGRVLVHGCFAPVIGRVCMDQLMIDVSEVPNVKVWDTVTLVGRDQNEFIPVEEPAELAGSFNYEFVCGISKRVPRIYYKGEKPVFVRTEFPYKA